jgi:hypothetical protein
MGFSTMAERVKPGPHPGVRKRESRFDFAGFADNI